MSRGSHAAPTSRRREVGLVAVVLVAVLVGVVVYVWPSSSSAGNHPAGTHAVAAAAKGRTGTTAAPASATTTTIPISQRVPAGPPTDQRRMTLIQTIGGPISPKSVDASGSGLVFAQNMMYRHTVSVYSSAGVLVNTIPDSVDMSQFGYAGHPGLSRGAPVEAAFTPDARYVYVSNYSMYGAGFGPEGSDTCTPGSARAAGDTNSYVYRINTATLTIDQAIQVGLVPKFVAVSPDDKYLLVANWCSYDLSVVDIASAKEVARLPMGAYPRGIAISPDSTTGYVAIMGGGTVVKVNLPTLSKAGGFGVGSNPRHVVLDPTGRYLYVSLNGSGTAVKVDLTTDRVVASVHTGSDERSLAISADGLSLYVVNYLSNTVTKLRAADMAVLQTVPTGVHPIGITYDRMTGNVWVAVYSGQILVFADH
jgi:YVTN family beta-propeller protein